MALVKGIEETLRNSVIDAAVEEIAERLRAENADPDADAVFEQIQDELFRKFPKMNDQEIENTAISVIVLMTMRNDPNFQETSSAPSDIGTNAKFLRLIPTEEEANPEKICV